MALKQPITQDIGYDASYWRITRIRIDWLNKVARVRLSGYKDEAARQERPNQGVMETRTFTLNGSDFENYFGLPSTSDYPDWESTIEYAKGDIVSYDGILHRATGPVATEESPPDENDTWEILPDINLDRQTAYDYVKQNDVDFVDAENT